MKPSDQLTQGDRLAQQRFSAITEEVLQTMSTLGFRGLRPALATISGLLLGTFMVSVAGCGGNHSTIDTTPPQVTVRTITVGSAVQTVPVNGTGQFMATGSYSDGSSKDVSNQVTWSSSSSSVASVNTSGLATGLASGTTTITATLGGVHGSKTLTVTPILSSIIVTPAAPSTTVNATEQFSATGVWSDGSTQDVTSQATWSSSDSSIASIDTSGLASTFAAGTVTISAAIGNISASDVLTVTAPTLSTISLTPAEVSVPLGVTQPFTATGSFSDGSSQQLASVTWSSSDTSIVSIDTTGIATTLTAGTVTISATSGSVTGSTALTVLPAALVSISLAPASPSLAAGNTVQFAATGLFTDNSTQALSGVTWQSSDATVATIDNAGLVSTLTPGTVTITAMSGVITGSATLTVTSATVTSIALTPANPSIPAGAQQQFVATGTFSDGSSQDITQSSIWTSSAGAVANVDSSGLATSFASGSTTITAALGAVSGSTDLTVTSAVLQTITITPSNLQMATGTTAQLTATGSYSDGSTQDLTATVTWTSAPASVATINASGFVTAQKAGTTTITATSNGVSGSTTVAVADKVLQSIVVTPVNPSAAAGTKFQFTATANYADGTSQDVTKSAHWSTSSASIATINSGQNGGGLATAKATGVVTITATLNGTSGSTALTVD